ncbi:MAG: zinc-ribbon domain-containing protein [Lachnospiraceae bacterium]
MTCSKCGKEIADGSTVCPECGATLDEEVKETVAEETVTEEAPVEETKTEPEPATQEVVTEESAAETPLETVKHAFLGLSKNAKIAIAAVAVVLVVLLIACFSGGKDRYTLMEYGTGYYLEGPDEFLFNLEGDTVESDEMIYTVYHSADASLTAFLDFEDTLYVIGKKGIIKVNDDVDAVQVSFYGDTIAYVKDTDDYIGSLYLYNVSKGKSTLIDRDVYIDNFVLSPDGKSVAYIGGCEASIFSVEGDLYLSKKGKEGEKLYSNSVPLAITDGGKHVYYVKDKEKLYVDDERITSAVFGTYYFNVDNTELLYEKDGNTYYYTLKFESPVKLKGTSFRSLVAPADMAQQLTTSFYYNVATYGIDTFNESLINLSGDVYYVSDEGESVEKVGSMRSYQMTADGESLIFRESDGDLQYIKNIHKSLEAKQLGDDLEAESFSASKDLKKVYYLSDGELFYLKGDKGVRVADEADAYIYSDKYGVVYFICDEELFYATTKAKSKERVLGESVTGLMRLGDQIIFGFEDEDYMESICRISGKKKTEVLVREED